ncbi:hypothetical protein HaLaN_31290, partial [Haematococcus lacustris]
MHEQQQQHQAKVHLHAGSRIWTPHWLCKTIPPVMGNCNSSIKVYNRQSVLDRASCSNDVIPRGGIWL